MHVYPPGFAQEIIDFCRQSVPESRPVEMPSLEALTEMLEAAFFASCQKEEGRSLYFRIAYCSPASQAARQVRSRVDWIPFQRARPCTAAEIRRLAPALDPQRSMLCCHWDGGLIMDGILFGQSDYEAIRVGYRSGGRRLPPLFNVTALNAGCLAANRGDECLVELSHGKIRHPVHLAEGGPILRGLHGVVHAMQEEAWASVPAAAHLRRPGSPIFCPYIPFLKKILHTMEASDHGGSLLLIPHDQTGALTSAEIDIKYRLCGTSAWDKCLSVMSLLISQELPENIGILGMEEDQIRFDNACRDVMTLAEVVGNLGAVDGALLLTDRLEILGFGAEIRLHADSEGAVELVPDARSAPRREIITHYGTRHRSIVRFCKHFRQAIGFILSQDGGLKAVASSDAGVTLWGDVAL